MPRRTAAGDPGALHERIDAQRHRPRRHRRSRRRSFAQAVCTRQDGPKVRRVLDRRDSKAASALGTGGDHMSLNSSADGSLPMAARDRLAGAGGDLGHGRRAKRLQLISQRRPLAVGYGRVGGMGGRARVADGGDLDVREPGQPQFGVDQPDIMVAVRGSREEPRRVAGKRSHATSVTMRAKSFSSIRSHTLKRKRPPGLSTRLASR